MRFGTCCGGKCRTMTEALGRPPSPSKLKPSSSSSPTETCLVVHWCSAGCLDFSSSSINMAAAPTKEALVHLYSSTLRASRAFSSYNFRQYFVRRTKGTFREIQVRFHLILCFRIDSPNCPEQNERDPAKLSAFYNDRIKELAVIKRSAIVNSLYGGWRLVVEEKPEETLERSDS